MLAEIYGWFTEGFATADLQVARHLLLQVRLLYQDRIRAKKSGKKAFLTGARFWAKINHLSTLGQVA